MGVAFAWIAYGYSRRYGLAARPAAGIYCCFLLLLAMALAPGFPGVRARIEQLFTRKRQMPLFIGVACIPYLIYAAGTGDFQWLAWLKLAAIAAAVIGIYTAFPVNDAPGFTWQDAGAAALLIGVVLSGQLKGIWRVPLNLDFMGRLFLLSIGAWCWVFVRRALALGYEFRFSSRVLGQAALNFGYFSAIAIPLSLAMRFTQWNPRWRGLPQFALDYLEIFLFIALLEELFFRGFLQTLLTERMRSWAAAQATVAVVFGLFHILHAPFPNWRYVALASIAGWFYGSAFRNGGNLMASALMHAAVDTLWRTWLTAGR